MSRRILYNASIINEGTTQTGYVIIEGDKIAAVGQGAPDEGIMASCDTADDLAGAMLLPGVIDDQVHFREPGLTHKATIASESAAAVAGASLAGTASKAAEVLPSLMEGEWYTVARISCLRDGGVARGNVETMGLKNTGGYIFYDGNNENWLDPSKQATKDYLSRLVCACADLGFDEILLTDLTYPTVGKLDKIAYGFDPNYGTQAAYNTEQIADLLAAVKEALGDRNVKLSLELSETVLGNEGVDETAGIDLWNTLMARLDRIYVPTVEDRVDAMVTDGLEDGVLVPELTDVPAAAEYQCYLLLRK